MHENQITYPATGRTRVEQGHGLVTWTSLLAADAVAFNSEFHRTSLLGALPGFLGSFPPESHPRPPAAGAAKTGVAPGGGAWAVRWRGWGIGWWSTAPSPATSTTRWSPPPRSWSAPRFRSSSASP